MTIVNNTYPGGIRFQTTTLVNEDIYTVLPTDYFILIGGSGTDLILNKQTIGQEYAIKNISTNSISISGSSCSIDGQSTCLLNSNESFWFLYDGNNYQKTLRDFNYIPISTINGLSGTNIELTPSSIGAQPSGSYLLSGTTTSLISEGTNKYYTDAKARAVISGTYPMAVTNGLIEIAQATTTANGYLTSTDWNTFNNKQTSITGAASTITTSNLSSSIAVITDANGKISGLSTVSSTELGYLDGVTSSIQTQLNAKQPSGNFVIKTGDTMSGDLIFSTGNSITINSATGNTVAIFNASKELFSSSVTSTELGYLDGVTSAIQTQLNNKQAVSTGAITTITGTNLSASVAVVSDVNGKISGLSTVSVTELGYLNGVTSAIQTQIDSKQAIATGAITTVTGTNLTVSMALVSDASGKIANHASVTATELGYLDGVTSAIQTQLNNKQASGNYLISGVTTTYIPEGTNQYYTDTKARAVVSGTTPITVSNGGISISQANTTTNGYLTSTDWNTFNNKITSGTSSGAGYSIFNSKSGNNLIFNTISGNGSVNITYSNGLIKISGSSTVDSVNGMIGDVIITATGIGAQPSGEYVSKLGDTIYGNLLLSSGISIIPDSNFNYLGNSGSYFKGIWTEKIISDNLNYQDMAFRNNYEPLLHFTNNQYKLKNISNYWSGVSTQPYNYGCFDGEYFWIGSFYTKKLLKINQSTIESAYTLDFPILCLASDNNNIWVGCADDHAHLIQVDQKTGSVLNTYTLNPSGIGGTNNGGIQGLAYDGKYLWAGISQFGDAKPVDAGMVIKIDCENGNQLISYSGLSNVNGMLVNDQITASGNTRFIWTACDYFVGRINTLTNEINKYGTNGLSYRICTDGDYVYTALYDSGLIKKILAKTGEVVDVWQSGPTLNTIAFDGKYIWVAGNDDNVTIHDRNTGKILMKVPGFDGIGNTGANSLVFDGTYMWTVGFGGNIRKMSISDKIGNAKFANSISIMDSDDNTGIIMSARRNAVLPGTSGTYTIGSLNYPFSGIYANNIYQNGIVISNSSGTSPISVNSGLISISQANTTTNGYLTSTDWNTFNNKQESGTYLLNLGTVAGPIMSGSTSITLKAGTATPISSTSSLITLGVSSSTRTIYPTTNNTYDLGQVANGWKNLYLSGTAFVSGITTKNGILPTTTGTINIGSLAYPFSNIYTNTLTVSGNNILTTINTKLTSGTTTTYVPEGTNLYYTDTRARAIVSGTTPITVSNGGISISQANTTTNGYLTSTDWNTFNTKQAVSIGAVTTITGTNLTTSVAVVSDVNGKISGLSTVSVTELGYLNGVTSAIQTQIDTKLTSGTIINISGATFVSSGTALIGSTAIPASGIYTKTLNNQIVAVNIFNEVPTGLINNVNKTYTLLYTPVANSTQIYMNGARLCPSGLYTGVGDYTILGTTLSMSNAPISGSVILADYVYQI
jgi:hypothetical protein